MVYLIVLRNDLKIRDFPTLTFGNEILFYAEEMQSYLLTKELQKEWEIQNTVT